MDGGVECVAPSLPVGAVTLVVVEAHHKVCPVPWMVRRCAQQVGSLPKPIVVPRDECVGVSLGGTWHGHGSARKKERWLWKDVEYLTHSALYDDVPRPRGVVVSLKMASELVAAW